MPEPWAPWQLVCKEERRITAVSRHNSWNETHPHTFRAVTAATVHLLKTDLKWVSIYLFLIWHFKNFCPKILAKTKKPNNDDHSSTYKSKSCICIIINLYLMSIQRQIIADVVMDSTCGILKGMCGLWKPTAKKNGRSLCTWLFSRLMASSVLSMSGSVPPGCSVTFTAHSKLTWSRPSSPLHTWKQRVNAIHLQH